MRNFIPAFCLLALLSSGCVESNNEGRKTTLVLPRDEKGPKPIPTDSSLVVLMVDDSSVFAFHGKKMNEGKQYTYMQLRSYLISRQASPDFMVFIKPGEKSTYQSTVKILDEMTISDVKNYNLSNPEKEEQKMIDSILAHPRMQPPRKVETP